MKLKTRLSIAFLTLILIPIVLTVTMVCLLGRYQISAIEKTYEISGTGKEFLQFGSCDVQADREAIP